MANKHDLKTPAIYPNDQYEQAPYDLLKEGTIAMVIVGALVLVFAGIFSTPDVPALSAKQVVTQEPMLLVQTELNDLGNQSLIATYGPPYNHGTESIQSLGSFSPQAWAGIQIPITPAYTDVIRPLERMSHVNPQITYTLATWNTATSAQQQQWVKSVENHLSTATIIHGQFAIPGQSALYGPVPAMVNEYLNIAQSGLLEAAIDGSKGPTPILNRTKSLLLFQGNVDSVYASKLNMLGGEWGIMKETGNYPGAVWLWYYTLLYQIPPYSTSSSGDLMVVVTILLVTGLLMFTPFIPGLRSIPRWLGVYRLIWRDYYREEKVKRRERKARG
ncbi:hypothetical protein [Sulfoacidibacillus ferrooxidans]|uniref:Cytochrome B6 n=1 Tax=Sulfoacidibacillus ferrooxidans TaxID=2005001 RepID=A0A9X1VBQ1_9BACL|nr:hypothetical protein [Sulfoacidibacillus ferrooxidans]MCI0184904.1 hypothetical protein [Sulfoacidibacillus ferrooxidans]